MSSVSNYRALINRQLDNLTKEINRHIQDLEQMPKYMIRPNPEDYQWVTELLKETIKEKDKLYSSLLLSYDDK